MKKLTITLFLIVLAFAGLGNKSCKKDVSDTPNGTVALSRENLQRTASGVRVYSKQGISQSYLDNIERGLLQRTEAARNDGHTLGLNLDLYDVFIPLLPCEQSPVQRIWSFKVRADNYDQTEYDIDPRPGIGVIYASEMVTSFNGSMVICPQEAFDAVGNGADHIILSLNPNTYSDGLNYFYATLTHTTGGHPLLPRPKQFLILSDDLTKNKLIILKPKEFSRAEVESFAKDLGVEIGEKDTAMKGVLIAPVK